MGLLIFPSVWVHMLMFSSLGILCAGDDRRLLPGNPISINQTLTSSDGTFALGFFSPENSTTRRYAGIWYNNLPGRTVVWVANREAPLEGASGVLAVTADGNIALLDGDGTAVWSTNLSGIPTNTSAELLDSGNLVLADAAGDGGGGYLWQSFDNPTDHYLPTMQLRLDLKTGRGQSLVAWRDPQDPSPGRFSLGIDPRSPLQVVLREGSRIRWRGGPWSARQAIGFRDDSGSSMFVEYSAADEEGVSVSYAGTGAFALSRYVLRPTGDLDVLYWNHRASNWSLIGSVPDGPCEIYEPCGPFGYCEFDGPSALCRCLQGFEPKDEKDWAVGNFSGGCVRRLPLALDRTDAFLKSDAMKLPDKFSVSWNVSAGQCEAACLEHRRCTAYAFANLSGGDSVGSRCLLWDGELLDLARRVNTGEDLFVRVAASELGKYFSPNFWSIIFLPKSVFHIYHHHF
uniref:G-type lectin S-receptor-like serine/threonine-protein kinase SD1-29 n=1 Tax=Anthurium amnicola TaxID=1678845 RepID=A0A1D1ZGK0_9ARAE